MTGIFTETWQIAAILAFITGATMQWAISKINNPTQKKTRPRGNRAGNANTAQAAKAANDDKQKATPRLHTTTQKTKPITNETKAPEK